MPRKQELKPEDVTFRTEWARQLKEKYRQKGELTDQEFADELDVKRQTLFDYMNGDIMPGLRTVYLAAKNLDIKVPYGDFDTKELVRQGRKRKNSPEGQMLLPFAIESLRPQNIEVELGPKRANSVGLNLTIRFVS